TDCVNAIHDCPSMYSENQQVMVFARLGEHGNRSIWRRFSGDWITDWDMAWVRVLHRASDIRLPEHTQRLLLEAYELWFREECEWEFGDLPEPSAMYDVAKMLSWSGSSQDLEEIQKKFLRMIDHYCPRKTPWVAARLMLHAAVPGDTEDYRRRLESLNKEFIGRGKRNRQNFYIGLPGVHELLGKAKQDKQKRILEESLKGQLRKEVDQSLNKVLREICKILCERQYYNEELFICLWKQAIRLQGNLFREALNSLLPLLSVLDRDDLCEEIYLAIDSLSMEVSRTEFYDVLKSLKMELKKRSFNNTDRLLSEFFNEEEADPQCEKRLSSAIVETQNETIDRCNWEDQNSEESFEIARRMISDRAFAEDEIETEIERASDKELINFLSYL
ncbi:MAG: hypothetical protein KC964_30990, partial [Candidatus Omnitrophica bacterium]|nr:hypothetical protein [Candidatus Omnitrophota bacterium]